jgi:site-specific recombinase
MFFLRAWQAKGMGTFGLFRTDLSSLMASAASAQTLGERTQWLEDLLDWIRIPASPEGMKAVTQIQAVRVKFLLQALDRNPKWKEAASKLIISVLLETEPVSLLSESGLSTGDGFFAEASERIVHRLIPTPKNERNLAELFSRIFHDESDAEWLKSIDENTLQAILGLFFQDPKTQLQIQRHYMLALSEALIIVSSHLESLGLTAEIRHRSQVISVRESAFHRLHLAISRAMNEGAGGDFAPLFRACREEINSAFAHLEEQGVSVSIVYRLEKMEKHLERLEALLAVYFESPARSRSLAWVSLLSNLVRTQLEKDRIYTLIQHNLHMLARKIVERTGVSGEHYITSSKREYFGMLFSAAGGGAITVGTTLVKLLIVKANPALFFDGIFNWINYSVSFILMQVFHFTLATKQPAMTAPALAAKLKESQASEEFARLVAQLTRSQFAAAVGNVGAAILVAFAVDFPYFLATGHHFYSPEYAEYTILSLHPFKTFTIPFAVITGIILWLSSIGAGWGENWFVYRRLPETITQSPFLRSIFGAKRSARISNWIVHNVSGIGGNISLGFLLAFTPITGRFFGLPLAAPHVTLSTCALTLAFCAQPVLDPKALGLAAVSILSIGMINFGVSFAAALVTAVKAREVKKARLRAVRRALGAKFRRSAADFFYPGSKEARSCTRPLGTFGAN